MGRTRVASTNTSPATGAALASFTTIQPASGTSPVAVGTTDTLNLTSSNGTVGVTGNSSTDTIDFSVATGSATQGQGYIIGSAGTPIWFTRNSPIYGESWCDDFTALPTTGHMNWSVFNSGTGAAAAKIAGESGHPGIIDLTTGSTNTGRAGATHDASSILLGGGTYLSAAIIRVGQLSTSTDEFIAWAGFGDTTSSAQPVDGAMLIYDRAFTFTCTGTTTINQTSVTGLTGFTNVVDINSIQATQAITGTGIAASTTVSSVDYVNGNLVLSQNATASGTVTLTFTVGNFWAVMTSNNSTRSRKVTSVAVTATTWKRLIAIVNSNATNVDYYIDSMGGTMTKVASITTNIPSTTGRELGLTFGIAKTVGTTACTMDIDAFGFDFAPSTLR